MKGATGKKKTFRTAYDKLRSTVHDPNRILIWENLTYWTAQNRRWPQDRRLVQFTSDPHLIVHVTSNPHFLVHVTSDFHLLVHVTSDPNLLVHVLQLQLYAENTIFMQQCSWNWFMFLATPQWTIYKNFFLRRAFFLRNCLQMRCARKELGKRTHFYLFCFFWGKHTSQAMFKNCCGDCLDLSEERKRIRLLKETAVNCTLHQMLSMRTN
jgi:hypothetical protein